MTDKDLKISLPPAAVREMIKWVVIGILGVGVGGGGHALFSGNSQSSDIAVLKEDVNHLTKAVDHIQEILEDR